MRKLVVATWNFRTHTLQVSYQLFSRLVRIRPLVLGLEHDVGIRDVRRHWVRGDLSGTGPGKYPLDLRHLLYQSLFQARLHLHRLRQASSWYAQCLQSKVPLAEARDELAAHATCQYTGQHHQGNCAGKYCGSVAHDPAQYRLVAFAGGTHNEVLFLFDLAGDEERNCSWNKGHGKNHRPEQSNHHSERHGVEHLPFDPCQRKDRKVDHHDDQLAEDQGSARLS